MRCLLVVVVTACTGGTDLPPLTNATELSCPTPGDLPFRLMSTGFQSSMNASFVADHSRNKDEAADTLGNPGGLTANIYLDDAASPTVTAVDYTGAKARTGTTNGLFSTPLPGEWVSLWYYDPTSAAWQMIGRGQTDANGHYDLPSTGFVAPNDQPVYAMLEADGSCAIHYNHLMPPGSKFVVVDIDGTLTTADSELYMQTEDPTYVPMMLANADKMTQAWAAKGYPVVYLTARPDVYRVETRGWLADLGFPIGPVITAQAVEAADVYKTIWLTRMITDFGWVAVAAYGNADTDITAYGNLSIPLADTFIIGPEGGMGGTVAIQNNDYTDHIATFIAGMPTNP